MSARLTSDQKLARAIRASHLANQRAIAEAVSIQEENQRIGYELKLEYQIPDLANCSMTQSQAAISGGKYRGPLLTRVVTGLSEKEARQRIRRLQRDPQLMNARIVEAWHGKTAARFPI